VVESRVSSCFLVMRSVFGQDRLDRCAADQVGQAADHPAGALVQVAVEPGQGSGLVTVQPQGVFEGGDQAAPLIGERERHRGDEGEAPGDLASPDAGKQALALQVDPGIDEFSELKTIINICCSGRFPGACWIAVSSR